MKAVLFLLVLTSFMAANAGLKAELEKKFLPASYDKLTFDVVSHLLHEKDVEADEVWRNVDNRSQYDELRKSIHKAMVSAMGAWPEKTPLNARVVSTVKKQGYKIEKLYFESMPGVFVTANLFMPESEKFAPPYPAIVISCGHSEDGKDFDLYLRACVLAVKSGFAALIYDPYEQGERRRNNICSTITHNAIGVNSSLIGWSMPLLRTWDGIRAIDYVQSRKEIDREKIGFMGQSGGGTMASLMTAVDWRLKATSPSCYLTSLRHLCLSIGPQDAEQNIFGQLAFKLNHTGYVLLPDTKVAVTCRFRDGFPFHGTLDLLRTVKTLSSRIGRADNYAINSAPGPHGWAESTMTASIDWMRAKIKGEEGLLPLDLAKYRALDLGFDINKVDVGLSRNERGVVSSKRTMNIPGYRDIHDILRERLKKIVASRKKYSKEEISLIASRLAGVKTPSQVKVNVKEISTVKVDGVKLTRLAFVYDNALVLPACYLESVESKADAPAVIMVGRGGRGEWAKEAKEALQRGEKVLVADITGYGDIGKAEACFYDAKECPEEGVAVMLYLMGESITGWRARDILVLADWLKGKTSRAPNLIARSTAAIPAAHAKAASKDAFSKLFIQEAPLSWAEFVEKGDFGKCRYAYIVVNALLHYDWVDLL